MDCHHVLELMSQSLDSPLSPQQRGELEAHLAQCPDCAALLRTLGDQSQALRSLDCQLPAGLHEDILRRLPPQQPPRSRLRPVPLRRWGALAACLALVVALGAALRWQSPVGSAPTGAQPASFAHPSGSAGVQADPRSNGEPEFAAQLTFSHLPAGWQDVVEASSPDGAVVPAAAAQAFLHLLQNQGIPYQLTGDSQLDGFCLLRLAPAPGEG